MINTIRSGDSKSYEMSISIRVNIIKSYVNKSICVSLVNTKKIKCISEYKESLGRKFFYLVYCVAVN